MELDNLWLTRLQQLIFKTHKDGKISKNSLTVDGFSESFIQDAVNEEYLSVSSDKSSYEMTPKLRYMPATIASFKLDAKSLGNKFKVNDPQLIKTTYTAAKEYHLAALILLEKKSVLYNGENTVLIHPACMAGAFSSELYLKSILLRNGVFKTGHKLLDLYHDLVNTDQEEIIDMLLKSNLTKDRVLVELDNLSEAFVEIRYSHERTGFAINVQFLFHLLEVLSKFCKTNL